MAVANLSWVRTLPPSSSASFFAKMMPFPSMTISKSKLFFFKSRSRTKPPTAKALNWSVSATSPMVFRRVIILLLKHSTMSVLIFLVRTREG